MSILYGLHATDKEVKIPLRKIHVDVSIQGTVASFSACFNYENESEKPIEAVFILPLQSGISICDFRAEINNRTVVGQVEEKETAQEMYDDAISSGQTAFLLEESIDSDDIFKISIGNLPPGKEAKVYFTAIQTLKCLQEGEIHFVLPTVLNPRYTPSDSMTFDSWTQKYATVKGPYTFSLALNIQCGSDVVDVNSPTHNINTTIDKCCASVKLDNIEEFHKDVEVIVRQAEPFQPFAFLESGDTSGEFMASSVVMINFFPSKYNLTQEKPSPRDYIFMLDRSGSMSGSQMEKAKDSLLLFLKSLPTESTFNIISFGSHFDLMFEDSKEYNDENVSKAFTDVKSMKANYGGTEILEPLKELFRTESKSGLEKRIFLITDGEVANTKEVVNLVGKECRSTNTRCFTLGIGHGASTSLITEVAKAGNGMAEFARESSEIQKKVIRLLKYASSDYLENITLQWDSERITARRIPKDTQGLCLGDSLVLFAEIDVDSVPHIGKEITLGFTVGKKKISQKIPLQHNAIQSDVKFVHRCCAKALFSELIELDIEKMKIISISKETNVLCPFTAFVAVDDESREPVRSSLQQTRRLEDYSCSSSENSDILLECLDCSYAGAPVPMNVYKGMENEEVLCFDDIEEEVSMCRILNRKKKSFTPAEENKSSPESHYLNLVSQQTVRGSWPLSDGVTQSLSRSLEAIKKAIPSYLDEQPERENIWGTVLVLTWLSSGKFADVRMELMFVLGKASDWLDAVLTNSISRKKLEDDAKKFLDL